MIPNVVGSYTKGDFKDINDKINLTFKMLIYLTVPMAIGMSFLSLPIWHVFYGVDELSTSIFKYYILQVILYGLFTTLTTITQSMNQSKITIGSLIISFVIKLVLNVPMMYLLSYVGVPAYYGPIITDVLSILIVLIGVLGVLSKKYNFSYMELFPYTLKVMVSLSAMLVVLSLLKLIYFDNVTVLSAIITIVIYTVVGGFTYFYVSSKFKLLNQILGDNYFSKLKNKFIKKGKENV